MDIPKIGLYIRKVRKEKKMTLDDLADEYIPRATLSAIERGISKNPAKINYLLRKLDIHLSEFTQKDQEEKEKRYLEMLSFENKINNNPALALKQLHQLPENQYGALLEFLKGRCYFKLNHEEKSTIHFNECIKKLEKEIDSEKSNLKPYCLNHLAIMAFRKNQYEQALQFTNDGLAVFVLNGDRKYLYTTLLSNQSIYLYNLGRTEEALKTISKIKVDSFDLNMDTVIGMYDFQAVLNLEIKMYDEAYACAKKGLELAHINSNYERQLEIYTTLSDIYKNKQYYQHAEKCLLTAIELENSITKRHQLVLQAYLQLGTLYQLMGKYAKSQKTLQKAVSIAKKQKSMLEYTKTILQLAKTFLLHANYDKAISCYIDILQQTQDHSIRLQCFSGLAQAYLQLEDHENYIKYSKQYFHHAISS